jgi:hypothetical protein
MATFNDLIIGSFFILEGEIMEKVGKSTFVDTKGWKHRVNIPVEEAEIVDIHVTRLNPGDIFYYKGYKNTCLERYGCYVKISGTEVLYNLDIVKVVRRKL